MARMKKNIEENSELMGFFVPDNYRDDTRQKFDDEVDSELLEYINSKLELYNKLTEDRVNTLFKSSWFNEIYDQRLRGLR